jgi:predicted transcriptional regulator
MPQHEGSYGLVSQKVFHFLRTHPGELFTVEDIGTQTDCTPTQARMALNALVQHGVIDREEMVGGREGYTYRSRALIV